MENKYLIIGTHGKFGEELVKSAEMIIGKMNNVYVFSLLPHMSMQDYLIDIEKAMVNMPKETLCLVDLFGGTPSNTFAALSKKYNNHVVSGVNLAMLLEVYMNMSAMDSEQLCTCAVSTGKDSCLNVIEKFNNRI